MARYPKRATRTSEPNIFKCELEIVVENFIIFLNVFLFLFHQNIIAEKRHLFSIGEDWGRMSCDGNAGADSRVGARIWIHECKFYPCFVIDMNLNRKFFVSCCIQNNDFETNTIMEHSPSGIATVVARLIVKAHHYKPGTTRTYTCVGKSGARIVKESSKF